MQKLRPNTALLVIDMQKGFDDPFWGPRNNPQLEGNVASLLAAFRAARMPVIHVHHDSPSETGRLRRFTPGNEPKPEALPFSTEPLYRKSVNSAFIGTTLEQDLRARGIEALALVGLTTNHCVSTTARMAGNLGFDTMVVTDATATFNRQHVNGHWRSAEEVHQSALSDLSEEFATIVDTNWLLDALAAREAKPAATGKDLRGVVASLLLTVTVTLSSGAAFPQTGPNAVDPTVKPSEDFYAYANNMWLKATPAPATGKIDNTTLLRAQNAKRVAQLIDEAVAARAANPAGFAPDLQKIADYYESRIEEAAIEAKGMAPLQPGFADIAAIRDRRSLAAYLGRNVRLDDGSNTKTESLFGIWIHQGFHDAKRYAVHVMQGGLGLPDRDDYLDKAKAPRLELYRDHVAAMLRQAGFERAEERAAQIVALEQAIAATHATREDTDDVFKTDNNWGVADFARNAPGMDWDAYLTAANLPATANFVVWQPQAIAGSAKLVGAWPLDAWKDYLAFQLVRHYASVLPAAVLATRLSFEAALAGGKTPVVPDRRQLAIDATEAALGDAIGRLYVERWFPPHAKQAAVEMAANLRAAFHVHLTKVVWLTDATKAKALQKLAALKLGVGYPARWVDYTDLKVVRGDAFGNLQRAEQFSYAQALQKLNRTVDPDEWADGLYPHKVGAILNISPNSMQFAAGLLQPPYFDADGDMAANYGSAGAAMAHEISHSFDEVGNNYDAEGRLVRWWSEEDRARWSAALAPLEAQLDACEAAPGLRVKGKQVVAESFADVTGLEVAHAAYLRAVSGRSDVVKDGLSGEQRFFVAFAQRWRASMGEEALRKLVGADNHAPPRCRAGLVRGSAEWGRVFGVNVKG